MKCPPRTYVSKAEVKGNKLKVKELKTVTKMIMTDPTFAKQLITNKAPCEPQNNLMNQSK